MFIPKKIEGPQEFAPVEITLEKSPESFEEITTKKTTTTTTEVVEIPEDFEVQIKDTATKITEEIIRQVTTEHKQVPVVVQELVSQEASPGGIVYLECRFTGTPQPTFKWYHNGESLKGERYVVINYNDGVSQLCITEVTKDDHGTFVCEATNPLGNATTVAEIRVYGTGKCSDCVTSGMQVIKFVCLYARCLK